MTKKLVSHRAPDSLDFIANEVVSRIDNLFKEEIDRWNGLDPGLREPLSFLREMVLAGGKRLRPAFAYWAYVGAGGEPDSEEILSAGCALELLHTFAIIHDDIMDGSLTRRGLVAIHKRFQDKHEGISLVGESRRFGEGVGILLGDIAFVYADRMLTGVSEQAQRIFTDLRLEVNIGQYLDLIETANAAAAKEISIAQSQKIGLYKSGKYTVERPLHLGVALLGKMDFFGSRLTRLGVPLGAAFQLRDDLLGIFGDESVTGKPVGDDIREGKPTVLAAMALQRAEGSDGEFFRRRFGAGDLQPGEIARFQEIISTTGSKREVEDLIEHLRIEAVGAARNSGLARPAVNELEQLADYVAHRDL